VGPGNNITGGKRGSGKTTHGDVWLLDILTQCAWAAARTRDTYLSAQFWRLARRMGKKKAAVAVAHSILVICWHLLTNDCDYADLGGDYFTRRNTDRQRDRLIKQHPHPGLPGHPGQGRVGRAAVDSLHRAGEFGETPSPASHRRGGRTGLSSLLRCESTSPGGG
jgi:hypothetical protein